MHMPFRHDVFALVRDYEEPRLRAELVELARAPSCGPTTLEDRIATHLGEAYTSLRAFVSLDRKSVHYHKRNDEEVREIVDILVHQCSKVRAFVLAVAESLDLDATSPGNNSQRSIAEITAAAFSVLTREDWPNEDQWYPYEGTWYVEIADATRALARVLFACEGDAQMAPVYDAIRTHGCECFRDYVEPRARQLIAFYSGLERLVGMTSTD